jgi:hypothetical protein
LNFDHLLVQIAGHNRVLPQRLFHLFREGLLNAVALPEIESEPEQAAHQLLGCERYSAMLAIYGLADSINEDLELGGPPVANWIQDAADRRLLEFAQELVRNRAPLGPHTCVETS